MEEILKAMDTPMGSEEQIQGGDSNPAANDGSTSDRMSEDIVASGEEDSVQPEEPSEPNPIADRAAVLAPNLPVVQALPAPQVLQRKIQVPLIPNMPHLNGRLHSDEEDLRVINMMEEWLVPQGYPEHMVTTTILSFHENYMRLRQPPPDIPWPNGTPYANQSPRHWRYRVRRLLAYLSGWMEQHPEGHPEGFPPSVNSLIRERWPEAAE